MNRGGAALAVLLMVACVGDPPQIPPETAVAAPAPAAAEPQQPTGLTTTRPQPPPPVEVPRVEPAAEDSAAWARLAHDLEEENARLEAQLADARAQLESARDETARYRQGLERAIGELNRLGAAAAATDAQRQAAESRHERFHSARVHTLGTPQVQMLGDQMLVTGKLWNAGDDHARGKLVIELMEGTRVFSSVTQPLDVAARTEVSYAHTFFVGTPRDNVTYSARVRPEY